MKPGKLLVLKITVFLTGTALFVLPNSLAATGTDPIQQTEDTLEKISTLVNQKPEKETHHRSQSSTPATKSAAPASTNHSNQTSQVNHSTHPTQAASSTTATSSSATPVASSEPVNSSLAPASTTAASTASTTATEASSAPTQATQAAASATGEAPATTEAAVPVASSEEPTPSASEQQDVQAMSYSTTPEAGTAAQTPTPAPEAPKTDQLQILNQSISYQNGGQGQGQSIIDQNRSIVSTWGGASVQSGSDNQNTHFIGHNPGIFSVLFSLHIGDVITVTDGNGQPTDYKIYSIVQVDDSGYDIHDGHDYWDQITGTGGGERITLQTCIDDSTNLVVFANH